MQSTKNPSAGDHRVFWIEGFRGFASLAIVLWHTSNYISPYGEGLVGRLLWPSSIFALDLFFIISGFVMVVSTRSRRVASEAATFFAKRFVRIFPLYALATIAYILIFPASAATSETIVRSLLFLPGMINAAAPVYGFPIISVGWSLNYEMYFYFIFCFAMLCARHQWKFIAAWSIITLIAIPVFIGAPGTHFLSVERHYPFESMVFNLVTNPLLALFVAGMILGAVHLQGFKIGGTHVSWVVRSLTVGLVALQYLTLFNVTHGIFGAGLTLLPLMVVFTVTQSLDVPGRRVLGYLGAISFALYVAHPVVILILRQPEHQGISGVSSMAAAVGLSLFIAAAAHHSIEQPIASGFRQLLKSGWLFRTFAVRR